MKIAEKIESEEQNVSEYDRAGGDKRAEKRRVI